MADIRAGIVANLRTGYPDGVQVGKYVLSSPTPPTLQIRLGPITYDLAMGRGLDEVTLIVQGLATPTEAGQMLLDEWAASSAGVKAAIETDRSLGGAVNDCVVRTLADPILATVGGLDVLLAEWSVTVYPQGEE